METTSCACVISICYLRVGALAEDAAQETFVRAWRSQGRTFWGASSEKTWLTSIAVNVCRNMLRVSLAQQTGGSGDFGAGPG